MKGRQYNDSYTDNSSWTLIFSFERLLFIETECFPWFLNIHMVYEALNNIIRGCVISDLIEMFAINFKKMYFNLTGMNSAALGLNLN